MVCTNITKPTQQKRVDVIYCGHHPIGQRVAVEPKEQAHVRARSAGATDALSGSRGGCSGIDLHGGDTGGRIGQRPLQAGWRRSGRSHRNVEGYRPPGGSRTGRKSEGNGLAKGRRRNRRKQKRKESVR